MIRNRLRSGTVPYRMVSLALENQRRKPASQHGSDARISLSQAKSIGGIVGGSALAILARDTNTTVTLTVSGLLFAIAGVVVAWFGADRAYAALGELRKDS